MDPLFEGRNVLVTGGAGFIGSNLVRTLVDLGAHVTVIDSLVPEYGGNLFNLDGVADRIRLNVSDVRDEHSMKALVRGQDYLFNLAGQTSHMDSMSDPFTDLEINARAQLSILEACRHFNPSIRVVFASTRQIYGRPDYLPVDEKHPLRPTDVNGINKMAGEWYHVLYHNVYSIRCCALRLTNTFGPRMRIKDARQTFLGVWILQVLAGGSFEVWGGEQLRDLMYVDDCVDAMLRAAASDRAGGKVYNLGARPVISLRDLADLVVQVAGQGSYVVREFPPERKKIDIGDYYSDASLIEAELGVSQRVDLSDGLERTVAYFREHLAHYV